MTKLKVIISKYTVDGNNRVSWDYQPPGSRGINEWLKENLETSRIECESAQVPYGFVERNDVMYYFHMPEGVYQNQKQVFQVQSSQVTCLANVLLSESPQILIKVFLHRLERFFPSLGLHSLPIYSFSGPVGSVEEVTFTLDRVVDGLMHDEPLAPKDFFFLEEIARAILSPLLPLHLALQSFFGISRNDDGQLGRIRGPKGIDEGLVKSFQEITNVFRPMNIKDGEDFALLEDRLQSSKLIPGRPDDEQPLLCLVGKLFANISEMVSDNERNHRQMPIDVEGLEDRIEDIIKDKDLKEVCRILASTKASTDDDAAYNKRIDQINEWNNTSEEKDARPKSVISKIDTLADYLCEVIDFKNKSEQEKARGKGEE